MDDKAYNVTEDANASMPENQTEKSVTLSPHSITLNRFAIFASLHPC
jgi:hypothetical protein